MPASVVERIIGYCLARALHGRSIELHAVSIESNHYHLVLTDFSNDLPAFMKTFNQLSACALKQYYAETHPEEHLESVWSPGSYNAVTLLTPNAVLRAIAYTLTNPVKDGLVPDYRKWPGLNTRPRHWTMGAKEYERPDFYFDQDDPAWAALPLQLTPPPMLRAQSAADAVRNVEEFVDSEQRRHVRERTAAGKTFLGVKAVLAVDPFARPSGRRPPRAITPTLAAGGDHAAMIVAKKLLRAFRGAYRAAYREMLDGVDAIFPHGTYLLRERFKVSCAAVYEPPWCVAGCT